MDSINKEIHRTTNLSVSLNILMCIIKWLAGVFGNSYALIADAIESSADIISSIFVSIGLRISTKPADENHPYGHGRIEPLITFFVIVFMLASAGIIIHESLQNILTPHETPKSWVIIILIIIISWKETSYRYIIKKARKNKSSALESEAWHHRSDAISSIFALLGVSIAIIGGKGYEIADDISAIIAALFIIYNCYKLFKGAFSEIMDKNIYHDFALEIKEKSLEVNGIIDTEKCYVRKVGMKFFIVIHAIVDSNISVKEGHLISHNLKDYLMINFNEIADITVHIEPNT